MIAVTFLLLLVSYQLCLNESVLAMQNVQIYNTVTENMEQLAGVIIETQVSSLAMCGAMCSNKIMCLGMSYESTQGICKLHQECPLDSDDPAMSTSGWRILSTPACETLDLDLKTCINDTRDFIGGSGGTPFSDSNIWNGNKITAFAFYCNHDTMLDIWIKYGDEWGPQKGRISKVNRATCTYWNYTLLENEFITGVAGTTHKLHAGSPYTFINQLTIVTNKMAYNICGSLPKTTSLTGRRLLYISGRAGEVIDCIRFHWL